MDLEPTVIPGIASTLAERVANAAFGALSVTRFQDGVFVWVNDSFCAQVGKARDQIVGHPESEFGLFADPATRVELVAALRDSGRFGPKIAKFSLPDGREIYAEIASELADADGTVYAITVTRLMTEEVQTLHLLQRRDAILQAAAYAAQRFLEVGDFEEQLLEVLRRVGETAKTDRVFVYRNGTLPDGTLTMSIHAEWHAAGITPSSEDPDNTDWPYERGFERWRERLGAGEAIASDIPDLPEPERRVLGRSGGSIAVVPVFAGAQWWGFIGIFRGTDPSTPPEAEVEAIKVVAASLGAALERSAAESRALEAERSFKTLVEQLPGAVYIEGLTHGSKLTSYLSPGYTEMFGVEMDEAVPSLQLWQKVIHPDDLEMVLTESARTDETGEPYALEYRVIPQGGPMKWVSDRAVLVRGEGGEPLFWLGILLDITQRVKAEEELRDAEERLRALIEQVPGAVYTQTVDWDPDAFYMSPQIERILGHDPSDFLQAGFWRSLIHPEDRDRVLEMNDETDRTLTPFRADMRIRHKDGHWVWVRDEALLVHTGEGREPTWQGIITDISQEKEAEEEIRATAARLQALIEQIPFATYVQSPRDEDRFYISPQIERVTGFPLADFSVVDFWDSIIHPEDLEVVRAESDRTDETGEVFDMEYRIIDASGEIRWIHEIAVEVEKIEGGLGIWQGIFEDVTERKSAEEKLREAEERYRTLVELSPAIFYQERVMEGDYPSSVMLYMSPQVADLLGYEQSVLQEDPGIFWEEVIHPEDRDQVVGGSVDVTISHEPYRGEYRVVRADGEVAWVHDEATLVRVEADGTQYWHGFITDITERKNAETELAIALRLEREAVERLRALDDLKNTFLSAVSHDLRTPLAAIHGLALTLEREDIHLEPDESRDLARRIAANSRKLERLVTDLLDLDRLSRGIVEANLTTTDLSLVASKVVAEAEFLGTTPVTVEAASVLIAIDQPKVERIVENLLANTVRHTPAGTHVWVRLIPQEDGVVLAVEDDGPGVPQEMREAVFEAFRQGESPSMHSPGVGVGLSLVAAFAGLHGGRAWVEEREGGGASFRVFLPFPEA